MPIHFFCSKCNEELLVEDIHAGKQVRCPRCSSVLDVPTGLNAPGASWPQYDPNAWQQDRPISSNPYEMPQTVNGLADQIDSTEVGLKLTNVYTRPLLKGIFRFYGRFFVPMILWGFVLFAFSLSVNQIPHLFPNSGLPVFVSFGASLILFLLNICFFQYVINLAKKGNYSLENAFPSVSKLLRTVWGHIVYIFLCLMYGILFGLIFAALMGVGAGIQRGVFSYMPDRMPIVNGILAIAGVVIGIILLVKLIKIIYERGFFLFFILDRDKRTMESFAASIRYARGIDNKSNFNSYINVSLLIFIPLVIIMFTLIGLFFAPALSEINSQNTQGFLQQMEEGSLKVNAVQFFFTNIIAAPLYYSMMTMMYFLMTGQPTVLSGMLARHFDNPAGGFQPESSKEQAASSANSFSIPLEKMEENNKSTDENEKKDI
ncbi:MAG: hypothetical protein Q4G69_13020 [Planctomycetia bacterium]|nr:hypothetical protein [Planctomycetia bacterium]